jgi:hypothetical protein
MFFLQGKTPKQEDNDKLHAPIVLFLWGNILKKIKKLLVIMSCNKVFEK